jgi:putative transposase
MLRVIEAKLYLTEVQQATLTYWLRQCCRFHNLALEQRVKAYRRRKELVTFNDQCALLTELRGRLPALAAVPMLFARDAIRRLDRAFVAFFRRIKAGEKPGFPRFRPHLRYNSMEYLKPGSYTVSGNLLRIPKLGTVSFRAGDQRILGRQKLLRIIRRPSGWYAQLLVDDDMAAPAKVTPVASIGLDVGLESFASLSNGEKVESPRFLRNSERKLRHAQRQLSRCQRRSRNRRKAVKHVARLHERIAAQRKDFTHQQSRRLVNRFDFIAIEKLNIKGLAASHLAKSVHDAAWGMFTRFLAYKAEYAGKQVIAVDPCGTSQTCPCCGAVAKKSLSERVHRCPCGLVLDRDHAAAKVILARALGVAGADCGGSDLCAENTSGVSRPDEAERPHHATHG